MDCRHFRKHHVAFVDDTLPGVDVVRMQLHLSECAACERWDHQVRRSLLLVRNHLSEIEPSESFRDRLEQRLARERLHERAPAGMFTLGGRTSVAVLGLSLVTVSLAVVALTGDRTAPAVGRLQPVIASGGMNFGPPAPRGGVDATPAFVSSVSSGMAIIPALMLADDMVSADVSASVVQANLTTPAGR